MKGTECEENGTKIGLFQELGIMIIIEKAPEGMWGRGEKEDEKNGGVKKVSLAVQKEEMENIRE